MLFHHVFLLYLKVHQNEDCIAYLVACRSPDCFRAMPFGEALWFDQCSNFLSGFPLQTGLNNLLSGDRFAAT